MFTSLKDLQNYQKKAHQEWLDHHLVESHKINEFNKMYTKKQVQERLNLMNRIILKEYDMFAGHIKPMDKALCFSIGRAIQTCKKISCIYGNELHLLEFGKTLSISRPETLDKNK